MPPILDYRYEISSDDSILTCSWLSSDGDPGKPDFLVQFRAYHSNTTYSKLFRSITVVLRFDSVIIDLNNHAILFFKYVIGLPEEEHHGIVSDIALFANGLAASNAGNKTRLPIVVSIIISMPIDPQERAAILIDTFGKVVVKEDYDQQCPVCLGIPSIGEEVTYMSCFHYCHSNCLVKWFETNVSCPLCRVEC